MGISKTKIIYYTTLYAILLNFFLNLFSFGNNHACALLANDRIKCWGAGTYGKLWSNSLVLLKINYCNFLFYGASKADLKRLQKIENAAAGFVLKRHATITDVFELKWLPVEENIAASLSKTAHSALCNKSWPSYLRLSVIQSNNRNLRLSQVNEHNIDSRGCIVGGFQEMASKCFNELPINVKKIKSKASFNKKCFDYFF